MFNRIFSTVLVVLVLAKYGDQFIVDPDGVYNFEWEVSADKANITFELTVQNIGFIGLGISPDGVMDGADIFGVEIRDNGNGVELRDCYGVGHRPQCEEDNNNLELLGFSQNATTTFVRFSRPIQVGDSTQDQPIQEDGETVFIWAYGASVTPNLTYHGGARGSFGLDVFAPNKHFVLH